MPSNLSKNGKGRKKGKKKTKTTKGIKKPNKTKSGKKKKKVKKIIYKKAKFRNVVCNYNCNHEKCHHLRFVKYLTYQKKKHKINFYPSLMPYQQVHQHELYGVLPGLPDFHIPHPFKDEDGDVIYSYLDIELKVGSNILTKSETREIKELIGKGDSLVAVCYGADACKRLMRAYRDPKTTIEQLEKLCWNGAVQKEHVIG